MSFFTALFSGHKKSAALLTPPDGMRETDIALESSTCTGETVIGFCLMGLDKHRARTRQWRVPEKILFGAALLGGSAGAWAGMYVFHHKTRHWYFVVGIPLILAAQLALAVYFTR